MYTIGYEHVILLLLAYPCVKFERRCKEHI